jgi:hypothetical protein
MDEWMDGWMDIREFYCELPVSSVIFTTLSRTFSTASAMNCGPGKIFD